MKLFISMSRRSNPKLNAWVGGFDQFKGIYDKFPDTSKLFVSMTSVDKLGINPLSSYDTPLGIYSYPAEFVRYSSSFDALPFAGNQPFINVFTLKTGTNLVDLNTMTAAQLKEWHKKISAYYASTKPKSEWKSAVDYVERIIIDSPHNAKSKTRGGYFWYIAMKVSGANIVRWNKLMRGIGVDGCIDNGGGIIHTAEPTQAVFFSLSPIKIIDRIRNKERGNLRGRIKQGAETAKRKFFCSAPHRTRFAGLA